jgi:BirA family transcriptional regulator, biotin operon repressor / biotin---[acetyl-CoA-carboxylase] ligase
MIETPDLMSADEIKLGLGTEILGREIISYAETGSTNDVALALAAGGAQEGTLIVAESQTRGRGRRSRKWIAPMGTSILTSLILRPPIKASEAQIMTLTSATAVAQAIRSVTQLPAFIKWPNDVIIGDRKVSGILTEMRTEKDRVKFLVVGAGVTVNISRKRLPDEIKEIATSLSAELGHHVSRIALLQEILRQLEQRYVKVKEHNTESLIAEWRDLLDTVGKQVQITLPRQVIRGDAIGIDETGALLVQTGSGQIQRITADMDYQFE